MSATLDHDSERVCFCGRRLSFGDEDCSSACSRERTMAALEGNLATRPGSQSPSYEDFLSDAASVPGSPLLATFGSRVTSPVPTFLGSPMASSTVLPLLPPFSASYQSTCEIRSVMMGQSRVSRSSDSDSMRAEPRASGISVMTDEFDKDFGTAAAAQHTSARLQASNVTYPHKSRSRAGTILEKVLHSFRRNGGSRPSTPTSDHYDEDADTPSTGIWRRKISFRRPSTPIARPSTPSILSGAVQMREQSPELPRVLLMHMHAPSPDVPRSVTPDGLNWPASFSVYEWPTTPVYFRPAAPTPYSHPDSVSIYSDASRGMQEVRGLRRAGPSVGLRRSASVATGISSVRSVRPGCDVGVWHPSKSGNHRD
ncbi:hypothetical protein K488DRAFT_71441 [Vararia minispora EC-137]|uniref:Uncharacterized protein n=1 Tax=Vararia minispora EC-137 TaxID=1314806 RepID=A0ACB8QI52_9AGAM|nr:hypothetical protein K488DRAFT_71441 [Vararia minispora EC-137]